ncbi:hypothetical protein RintRC_4129 [Richelia intracellularis]|nr:hypothetical protein RintRC_4129 [Richelia intracellularis]
MFVVRWERISACFDAFLPLATIHIWINKIILVGYLQEFWLTHLNGGVLYSNGHIGWHGIVWL